MRIFTICLFLLSIKNFGQTYVPMPMQNCYWEMNHSHFCSQASGTPAVSQSLQLYKMYPNNDTVIATIKYVKFYIQSIYTSVSPYCNMGTVSSSYWGAVRQDTLGKKIFIIFPSQASEQLLYNFNYIKGDTVKTVMGTFISPPPGYDKYRIVDSVFYQSYTDGICRKTFRLKPYIINIGSQITEHNYFTEGIGNEVGINQSALTVAIMNINYAEQESWSSFLTINNFTISATAPNNCQQDVDIIKRFYESVLSIYPNPAQNQITINIKGISEQNFITKIYDILGNEMLSSENQILTINHLKNGYYLIKCLDKNTNQIITSRFIKN